MATGLNLRDQIFFTACTVAMEAEGEPFEGKLAVAFVVVRRPGSPIDAALKSYQFSAWNTASPTRQRLDDIDEATWNDCYKAACAAVFGLVNDPSNGATHYLNKSAVLQATGKLPPWYRDDAVTAEIGKHTFLIVA